jgi:hypothetical protein
LPVCRFPPPWSVEGDGGLRQRRTWREHRRGSATLHGLISTGGAEPQVAFRLVEPRAARPGISAPPWLVSHRRVTVEIPQVGGAEFASEALAPIVAG